MPNVYVEARPKGRPEGTHIDNYVVEDHADHVLQTFKTQRDAIDWAKKNGHTPHVARVRHLTTIDRIDVAIQKAVDTSLAQSANDLPSGFPQSQQPDMVKLKGEAQNAFNVISSDKLKTQTFCEMADLGNQLDRADRANDTKKTEEVSQKMDELEKKLPEYTAIVDGLKDMEPNSEDAQEIGSIILKLDELCD